jgi:phosphatidylserine decarboxylase
VAIALLLFLDAGLPLTLGLLIPLGILWFGVCWFFRDPSRSPAEGCTPDHFISPADGVVSAIEHHEHHADLEAPAVVIRIFLSVLDVHVNRYPCDGRVLLTHHVPGRHHDARRPECATENEFQLLTMQRPDGTVLAVRQIAGLIARRIVCLSQPGDAAVAAVRFGMIKFGSSTELILPRPDEAKIPVSVGDRVWGGHTLLAQLSARH